MFVLQQRLCNYVGNIANHGPIAHCGKFQVLSKLASKIVGEGGEGAKQPKKMSLKHVNVSGKRILMRVDFNVPMKDGKITNNQRIVAALPSIKHLLERGCKSVVCRACNACGEKDFSPRWLKSIFALRVVLASHMGRPNGQRNEKFSLSPVAKELEKLLKWPVCFIDDCVGQVALEATENPPKGAVILLENLRFYKEETGSYTDDKDKKKKHKADPLKVLDFRCKLSKLADIYVNDAFGTAHRAHSSMLGEGYEVRAAGLLLDKELQYFAKALETPKKPFLAILGGAKIADKIPLIKNLLNRVDQMIVTGGMAYTFLKVNNNMEIGKSLFDEKGSKLVEELMCLAKEKNVQIFLPIDFKCAQKLDNKDPGEVKSADVKQGVPKDFMGLDIGEKTIKAYGDVIFQAKTIIWNGPPGLFENEKFANGTKAMLEAIICATKEGATTIVGGGDTATACKNFGGSDKVSHVSTGGGAALELLEGNTLPGIAALSDAK